MIVRYMGSLHICMTNLVARASELTVAAVKDIDSAKNLMYSERGGCLKLHAGWFTIRTPGSS